MATRKPKADQAGQTEARALVDLPTFGVVAGDLLVAEADEVAALVASGAVDPHPDAVAYAKTMNQ